MDMTLLILAAGMGSRYGGLKQLDPVTDEGEFIIDFSVYDAIVSGFDKIVFVIYGAVFFEAMKRNIHFVKPFYEKGISKFIKESSIGGYHRMKAVGA